LQVAQTTPGQKVTIKVIRDGSKKTFDITPKELPGSEVAATFRNDGESSADALSGVAVGNIDTMARSQLRLPENVKGALVACIDESSPAYEAGLREGDVIQEINRKPVKNAEEAIDLSAKIKGDKILLRVWSQGGSRFIAVNEDTNGGKAS